MPPVWIDLAGVAPLVQARDPAALGGHTRQAPMALIRELTDPHHVEKYRGDPAGRPYLYGLGGGCGGRAGPSALALPPRTSLTTLPPPRLRRR